VYGASSFVGGGAIGGGDNFSFFRGYYSPLELPLALGLPDRLFIFPDRLFIFPDRHENRQRVRQVTGYRDRLDMVRPINDHMDSENKNVHARYPDDVIMQDDVLMQNVSRSRTPFSNYYTHSIVDRSIDWDHVRNRHVREIPYSLRDDVIGARKAAFNYSVTRNTYYQPLPDISRDPKVDKVRTPPLSNVSTSSVLISGDEMSMKRRALLPSIEVINSNTNRSDIDQYSTDRVNESNVKFERKSIKELDITSIFVRSPTPLHTYYPDFPTGSRSRTNQEREDDAHYFRSSSRRIFSTRDALLATGPDSTVISTIIDVLKSEGVETNCIANQVERLNEDQRHYKQYER